VGFGEAEGGLVGETAGHGRVVDGLALHHRQVATILRLLTLELCEQGRRAVTLGRHHPHDDLVAQRRRPAGSPREPGAERAVAPQRETKHPPQPRTDRDVATRDVAASLELVEHLIDLADVRVPVGPHPLREALSELVAVRVAFAEQRHQRVSKLHAASSPERIAGARTVPPCGAAWTTPTIGRRGTIFTRAPEIALTRRVGRVVSRAP
jgi:hypothetical protein